MKRLSFFLFLLLVSFWIPQNKAQAPEFRASTADGVALNFAGFQAIPGERQAWLICVISDLTPEIVAAVEVDPDNMIHDVAAELTELGTSYDDLILDQTTMQNIGVIFKRETQVTNPRLIAGSDDGNSGLRKAFAVDVRMGQFDSYLIVLHLKSGR